MKLYADRLKAALEVRFHDLKIIDFFPQGLFIPNLKRFWIANKAEDYFTRFWLHINQLKHIKSDIFHIVDHANAYFISKLDANKVIVTCHDLITLKSLRGEIESGYEDERKSWFASKVFLWSCKYIPKALRLIADSNETKGEMLRLLGCEEKDIKVVYCGVDPVFQKIENKERLYNLRHNLAGDSKYILLHIGSKSIYKNFAGLIQAFYLLVHHYGRDIFLIRLGEVSKTHLILIKRLGLEGHIKILPEMPLLELNLLYNIADIFVFPSLYEGFGWPVVEAMACGTPVVSSDSGGLKEAVRDAACIVDPYDAKNIANGIMRVIEDNVMREDLIRKGAERIKELSLKKMAEETYQVYREAYS